VTVHTGAFIIWTGSGTYHSITANTTANGDLPTFGTTTLRPGDQYGFTFTVPGIYHYYDLYYPEMQGQINVHPPGFATLDATLGVDMNPSSTNTLDSQVTITASNFTVSVVAINATNLSSWSICLHYNTTSLEFVSVALGPLWNGGNTLGGGSIYKGDGIITMGSYVLSGTPGINATGLEVLFTVTFKVLNVGPSSLDLTGYLVDSNGYYIHYDRKNGSYNVIGDYYTATGCRATYVVYDLSYRGNATAGSEITLVHKLVNQGTRQVTIQGVQVQFGVYTISQSYSINIPVGATANETTHLSIPSTAYDDIVLLRTAVSWGYLVDFGGIRFFALGPDLVIQAPVPITSAGHAMAAFNRVSALVAGGPVATAAIDVDSGFAYFGSYGGILAKIRLSDFAPVENLTLNASESGINALLVDPDAGYAYFSTNTGFSNSTPSSAIVKVRLSDYTRTDTLTLNPADGIVVTGVMDSEGGFAYFGTFGTYFGAPGNVIRVRLSDFTRAGNLTLNPGGGGRVNSAVIDPDMGFAYFGMDTYPGSVIRVRLSDFTRDGILTLDSVEDRPLALAIDSAAGLAYFGTCSFGGPGQVVRVRLSDFTRADTLTLNSDESCISSALVDGAADFAYFGTCGFQTPGSVVRVRLSDFARVDSLTLNFDEPCLLSAIVDSGAGFAYFGTSPFPGKIVKVSLARPPGAPIDLMASRGSGSVTLTWSSPVYAGGSLVTGYYVYRATSPNPETLVAADVVGTTYTDTGLTNGQTYYYKVSAKNLVSEGQMSVEVRATPIAPLVNHPFTSGGTSFNIYTNSSISNFQYSVDSHLITFHVSGEAGIGVANITVASALVSSAASITVDIDGAPVTPSISQDAANYYVYVSYPLSARRITVILGQAVPPTRTPDVPSTVNLFLTAGGLSVSISALALVWYWKRRRPATTLGSSSTISRQEIAARNPVWRLL
jgi:hypothetical protein